MWVDGAIYFFSCLLFNFFLGGVVRKLLEHSGTSHFGFYGDALFDGEGLQGFVEDGGIHAFAGVAVFAEYGAGERGEGFAGESCGLGAEFGVGAFEFGDTGFEFCGTIVRGPVIALQAVLDCGYDAVDFGVEGLLLSVETGEDAVESFGRGGEFFCGDGELSFLFHGVFSFV
jgi:hypothetical protein